MMPKGKVGVRNKLLNKLFIKALCALKLVVALIYLIKKERIWLIGCGGDRWGDNADALWSYLSINHPDIKAYAVVKKHSASLNKRGLLVNKNSLKNIILFKKAEALITSHSLTDIGPLRFAIASPEIKVWLQHGVIGIKKLQSANADFLRFDMICASSECEKRIMIDEMKLDPDRIYITGLARHDILKREHSHYPRNGVLFMPTFRDWYTEKDFEIFRETLLSWVKEYSNIHESNKVKLWLHPNWPDKIYLISESDGLEIIGYQQDLQQILLQSEIFITDYSSVAFDAALSGVPVVFYQPDRDDYINRRGLYKDYRSLKNLLIVKDSEELINAIGQLNSDTSYRNFRIKEDKKWAFSFVETYDGKSCLRIVNQINVLVKNRKRATDGK
jgi:CDP-glycerol glycerophosphotransferase